MAFHLPLKRSFLLLTSRLKWKIFSECLGVMNSGSPSKKLFALLPRLRPRSSFSTTSAAIKNLPMVYSTAAADAVATVKIDSLITTLLDRLLLLSPRTWLGILEIQDRNHASPFSLEVLKESVMGLAVPLLLFWILHILTTTPKISSFVEIPSSLSSNFALQPT